jgi:hypothetical protein
LRKRIIQLWQGSVLIEDQALQLLLIIDSIFDWARDIYWQGIIRKLRNFTGVEDVVDEGGAQTRNIWSLQDLSHPLLRFTHLNPKFNPGYCSAIGTIRHASIVKFSFVRLHVPDNDIESFITSAPVSDHLYKSLIPSIINHLITVPLTVSESTISWLENTWMRENRRIAPADAPSVLARISFVTYFATEWQMIREIVCVTASIKSFHRLKKMSGDQRNLETFELKRFGRQDLEPTIQRIRKWADPECVMASIIGLRWNFDGNESLSVAPELLPASWKGRDVIPMRTKDPIITWAGPGEGTDTTGIEYLFDFMMIGSQSRQGIEDPSYISRSSVMEELSLDVSNHAPLFDVPQLPASFHRTGVILLKHARLWYKDKTGVELRYCLMVLEESDFVDHEYLAQKIAKAVEDNHLYLSRVGNIWASDYLSWTALDSLDRDRESLERWAEEVRQTPPLLN